MIITLLGMFPATVLGQRDAPAWESNLTRISVYHNNRTSCTVELDYKKEGGHYVHNEHQLYLLVYLKKDEGEIIKLAAEKADLNKKDLSEKSLVDMLIEKKLVKEENSRYKIEIQVSSKKFKNEKKSEKNTNVLTQADSF